MEWWIIAALALAVVVTGLVRRLRKPRRHAAERDEKTIYPLW